MADDLASIFEESDRRHRAKWNALNGCDIHAYVRLGSFASDNVRTVEVEGVVSFDPEDKYTVWIGDTLLNPNAVEMLTVKRRGHLPAEAGPDHDPPPMSELL